MKICEKCDHNVQIECQGGCFYPHRTPPCYREMEAKFTSHNSQSIKLRQIIIELGRRGVIGASERDTAIVDEICKREGII